MALQPEPSKKNTKPRSQKKQMTAQTAADAALLSSFISVSCAILTPNWMFYLIFASFLAEHQEHYSQSVSPPHATETYMFFYYCQLDWEAE